MQLHRVRRLAGILVASQLRSGRSSSNPRSFLGQPVFLGTVDAVLFLGAFALALAGVRLGGLPAGAAGALGNALFPFLPIVSVGVVLVAGLMFELTTTARFAQSDAANWLPFTPEDYVAASSSAIAYTYSPAVALLLGGLLPIALAAGAVTTYLLAAPLTVLALFEGGVLVEMVRSATQRSSAVGTGRRGQVVLVLRALLLVVIVLVFQLAFNPVFLLGLATRFSALGFVATVVPFFWSTESVNQWTLGHPWLAAVFAVAELAFVGLLLYLAALLRGRYWAPAPTEVRLEEHRYASRNPVLAVLGLTAAESALVTKDLKGLVRRREMLPTLVVPVVLAVLVFVEGGALGGFVSVIWMGWVTGFFALLVGGTSIGQERKAIGSLYAYPLSVPNLVRAKATFVLVPSLAVAVALSLIVGLLFGFSPEQLLGVFLLIVGVAVVLTFWGLTFGSRYADFQERPRPQFLRPGGTLAATGSGMVLLFAVLVPGAVAILLPSPDSVLLALVAAAVALGSGALAVSWTVSGFRRLFREIPF